MHLNLLLLTLIVCFQFGTARADSPSKAADAAKPVSEKSADKWPTGLRLGAVIADAQFSTATPKDKGAAIRQIQPGSVADKSGLLPGDLIVRFGEQPIDTTQNLLDQLARSKPGDRIVLSIIRGSEKLPIELKF
jgi:serine protease Do